MNLFFASLISYEFAAGLWPVVADAALKSVLVLGVARVLIPLMKKRSAATRHLFLFLTLASLLALPLLSLLLPKWETLPRWMDLKRFEAVSPKLATTVPRTSAPSQIIDSISAVKEESEIPHGEIGGEIISERESATSSKDGKSSYNHGWAWTLWKLGLMVWLIGTCCALLPVILGVFSLWRLGKTTRSVDAGITLRLLQHLSSGLGLHRHVSLRITDQRRMPMTWGLFHPTVLLPESSRKWSEERCRVILLHELAHVQRLDYLSGLVTHLACAMYWFNPLVWWAARKINTEREQACDDIVLREGERPSAYAEEVLQVAAGVPVGYLEHFGAIAMARPSSLEGRLLAILDRNRNRSSLTRTTALGAMSLVLLTTAPISMLGSIQNRVQENSVTKSLPPGDAFPGLVSWWQGEGNGNDSAGNHHGTFPFGVGYAPGIVGHAFDFRRASAYDHLPQRMTVADDPAFALSDAITLEAWINPTSHNGILLIRGDDRPGYDNWQLDLLNKGHISFTFNSVDNKGVGIGAPIQLKQWQHVVATFDQGELKLYINSALVARATTDLRPVTTMQPEQHPALGVGNAGGQYYNMPYDGLIDEVRIYNRALSESEIMERLRQ